MNDPAAPSTTRRWARWRRAARREALPLGALVALSALGVAQPVFSLLNQDPTVYLGRAAAPGALVTFALVVVAGPPLLLWLAELAVGAVSPAARARLHLVLVALLATAVLVQVGKAAWPGHPTATLAMASAAATALAIASTGWAPLRRWLAVMAPVSVVLAGAFLFASPATPFVLARPLASPAAVGTADADRPPVVVVVLDELGTSALLDGQGRIDAELFPHLAALADTSTWYRNTTTVASGTPLAVSAILTGQYPDPSLEVTGVPSSFGGSLFSLVAGAYETRAHEPLTRFCQPQVACRPTPDQSGAEQVGALLQTASVLFRQAIDPSIDEIVLPLDRITRDGGDPVGSFGDFIESLAPSSAGAPPRLDFLHVVFPHMPYRHLPGGSRYDTGGQQFHGAPTWEGPWVDEESAWSARQRHLLQAGYADALLGRLFDRLEDLDRFDESLIVVTADHGSSFRAGELARTVGAASVPDILWVPLLVKAPHQSTPVVEDRPTELVDVLPTVARHLGLPVGWDVDGQVAGTRPPDQDATVVHWAPFTDLEADPDGRIAIPRADRFAAVLAAEPLAPPDGGTRWRAFRRGPYAALVGQEVADQSVDPDPAPGEVDLPPTFTVGDGTAGDVPAYVLGRAAEGDEVAVAVDGRVAAVLPVHGNLGGRFWGLLPEHVLGPGRHTSEVFVVVGPPAAPILRRLDPGGAGPR